MKQLRELKEVAPEKTVLFHGEQLKRNAVSHGEPTGAI